MEVPNSFPENEGGGESEKFDRTACSNSPSAQECSVHGFAHYMEYLKIPNVPHHCNLYILYITFLLLSDYFPVGIQKCGGDGHSQVGNRPKLIVIQRLLSHHPSQFFLREKKTLQCEDLSFHRFLGVLAEP